MSHSKTESGLNENLFWKEGLGVPQRNTYLENRP
jgi:hypothetical protein